MITRLEAFRYRCFLELSVDVDEYQVLAGANGAGKTTLLDVPVLFQDLLQGQRVNDAFLRRMPGRHVARAHTLDELIHKGEGDRFSFALEAELPNDIVTRMAERSDRSRRIPSPTHLRYEVGFEVDNNRIQVAEEYLFLFSEDGKRPDSGLPFQGRPVSAGGKHLAEKHWQPVIIRELGELTTQYLIETTAQAKPFPPLRTSRDQLALRTAALTDDENFPASRWLSQWLGGKVVFYDPDWSALRQAAPPGDPEFLLPDGRNTPWLARAVQRDDPDRFQAWIDHVQTALPQIEKIEAVERQDDRYAYFKVCYRGGYEVTSSGLSDGTLRILALTLLPYLDPGMLPTLLVTEEPENGIHPKAIETVVEALRSLHGAQVWVSTHSPIVLANNALDELLIARLNNESGEVSVIPGREHPQLAEWKASPDLGTLYAAGVLS